MIQSNLPYARQQKVSSHDDIGCCLFMKSNANKSLFTSLQWKWAINNVPCLFVPSLSRARKGISLAWWKLSFVSDNETFASSLIYEYISLTALIETREEKSAVYASVLHPLTVFSSFILEL